MAGAGEISIDTLCWVDALPRPGESVDLSERRLAPGGQVATAVLACARLGLRCALAGAVGDDPEGERALAPLVRAGVDTRAVRRVEKAPTRRAVILVERASGERVVLGDRDRRLSLAPGALDMGLLDRARIVLLDARDPDFTLWAADRARDAGAAVVLDADTAFPTWPQVVGRVDFPIVARAFAEEVGEDGSVGSGLEAMARLQPRLAVVTLGELGAVAWGVREGRLASPAFRVPVVDTTGAGDAFHAGFAWGLARGRDAVGCLREANALAALSCTAPGAQDGLPEGPGPLRALLARETREGADGGPSSEE